MSANKIPRICVIEPAPWAQDLLVAELKKAGYEVVYFDAFDAAFDALAADCSKQVDVFVTHVGPNGEGVDFHERLAETVPGYRFAKFIYFTSHTYESFRQLMKDREELNPTIVNFAAYAPKSALMSEIIHMIGLPVRALEHA